MSAIKRQNLEEFKTAAHDELFGRLLPFWSGPALDHQQGGWMAWLTNDLKPDRSKPKGLVLNSRILWAFSASHRARLSHLYREMADRALEVLMNRFWDKKHGGAFWRLEGDGRVRDDSKKIYGQAFCIYALAEYHQAFNSPEALARAQELFELIEQHAHDPRQGGYLEVCRRDWSEAVGGRLGDNDVSEKKSMNNHLHVLEAWTNLCRVWKNSRVKHRLRELIGIFERHILDPRTRHLHHFFDDQWRVRSDSYTFGHDIEASWLLCEAAEVLGDELLLLNVRKMSLRIAEAVLNEGVDPEGGIHYEGRGGRVIDQGKDWWPQAEALVGFLNAFQLSNDPRYLTAAWRVWKFIEQRQVDRMHGEWFWRINPDGKPDQTRPKVSEWKCPYHNARACLETLRRLAKLCAD